MKVNCWCLCWALCAVSAASMAQSFTAAGSMNEGRVDHTATLLDNGTVLVTGGGSATAEVFNPQTRSWRYTAAPMHAVRSYHTATKLTDGRVLIAGGDTTITELFDPVTEQFTVTGALNEVHGYLPAALLLNDGRVMLVAGSLAFFTPETPEIYNPATGAWTQTPQIPVGVSLFAAVHLPSDTVLAFGGYDGYTSGQAYSSVESYTPQSNSVSAMSPMIVARLHESATVMPNNQILILGGSDAYYSVSSTELYDASIPGGRSQLSTSLNENRREHTATLLANGDVLVVGGFQSAPGYGIEVVLATAELRDHKTAAWSISGNMSVQRFSHTATLLPSGQVLVVGGMSQQYCVVALSSAELWTPAQESAGTINVSTNLANATFTITGPATYSGSGTAFSQSERTAWQLHSHV